ncbi:MAG TPA: FtsX-like permease family protein [Candidatus Limnocylindrales bacterium]|nr:FtsX-like permease family protein [Candidatus Limnocylindrales bacterium]
MGGLISLALRSLAARRGRTVLSVVGIALGIGVLYASLATDAGIAASIDRTVHDLVGRADVRIESFGETGLSAASLAAIEDAPGVAVAAPALQRRTYLAPAIDDPNAAPAPITAVGIDPAREPAVRDLILAAGRSLAGPDALEAIVTQALAATDKLAIGGTVTFQGAAGTTDLKVVGILAGNGPVVGSEGRTVILPLRTMQRVFEDPAVNRVDVVAGQGASPTEVAAALGVALTTEPYVLSSPADVATSLRASTADFRGTTALIAAVALFVGAFLIFNTLSMTVAERVRELGLLRAAGATRGQLVWFVVAQAIALGLAGSLAGLAVGVVLGELMAADVRSIGSIPFDRIDPSPWSVIAVVAIGLGVTIAASLEPARRAGSIPPVEALRERLDPASARRARLRWLVAVFVAVGIAGLIVWPRDAGFGGLGRSAAVYAILFLAVLAVPAVLGALGRLAGLPFRALFRLEERLARASIVRDRSRTTLTVGALAIALAMVVAVGAVAHQSRLAASAWLNDVIPGDELLTSIRPVALDEDAIAELQTIDGVERISPIALFEVARDGVRFDAAAIRGGDLLDDGRLRFIAGERVAALNALDAGGAAILPRSVAERTGLGDGSTLTLAIGNGRVIDLRVVGITERTLPGKAGEAVLVGWDDATNAFGVAGADVLAVRYEAGRQVDTQPILDRTARELALEPNPLERVTGAVDDALGRVFGLFDALALIAVIVAALGIVNTLTVSVLERVRELGVLRAAGMTTRQVRRTVVVEAGILGIVGAILGIVTGLVAAGLLVVLAGGGPLILDPPWASIAIAILLGIGISMVAAWYPAILASRLAIVAAVQHE